MQQTENLAPHVQEIARALQNRMEPEAIEDELRRYIEYGVPLAQAKRDIVRMHGGTLVTGPKKLADLMPEERGVEVRVKVLTVNPKEITVKGQPKTIWYGLLADDTAKLSYTAWKDPQFERGRGYRIANAYAKKGFREGVELNIGDYARIEAAELDFEVVDDFASSGGADAQGGRIATERKVRDLRDGQGSVSLTGRVLDVREKVISTANGQKTLVEGTLADETGQVAFSAWEPDRLPPEFKADAVVHVKGAYVRSYRGVPNLNFGQYSSVDVLPAAALPDRETLMQEKPYNLGELEAAGGGEAVLVRGVVLEVKKGSGIIFRCGKEEDGRACNRVLQRMECRVHGKQKGHPDLRVKAVLDDGFGAATFFAGREATEKILGRTLEQAQEMARDAMTTDVVQDEVDQKLTARRVAVRGKATSDEYGLQIIATSVDFDEGADVEAEAEKLLGSLADVMQEVGA